MAKKKYVICIIRLTRGSCYEKRNTSNCFLNCWPDCCAISGTIFDSYVPFNSCLNACSFEKMDANWLLGLGEANGAFCVLASRTGDSYTVNGTYFVTDTYDFEEDDMKIIFPGLINDNMFKLHSAGVAQAYYVYGEMEIEYHFYI